jgi:hypothetical protein
MELAYSYWLLGPFSLLGRGYYGGY